MYTAAYTPQLLKSGADWRRELSGRKQGKPKSALEFAMDRQGHDGVRAGPKPEPNPSPESEPEPEPESCPDSYPTPTPTATSTLPALTPTPTREQARAA